MITGKSNEEICWDEFVDWANDNGIGMEHKEDWEPWFECWCAAIEAKEQYDVEDTCE